MNGLNISRFPYPAEPRLAPIDGYDATAEQLNAAHDVMTEIGRLFAVADHLNAEILNFDAYRHPNAITSEQGEKIVNDIVDFLTALIDDLHPILRFSADEQAELRRLMSA